MLYAVQRIVKIFRSQVTTSLYPQKYTSAAKVIDKPPRVADSYSRRLSAEKLRTPALQGALPNLKEMLCPLLPCFILMRSTV